MSTTVTQGINSGTEIVSYSRKATGYFKGKETERVKVLGKERVGFVPLKVKKPEHEQAEYRLARLSAVQKLLSSDKSLVSPDGELTSPVDINVNKLWDANGFEDLLWVNSNGNIPHLTNGSSMWATFNPDAIITDVTPSKKADSTLELRATGDFYLSITMNDHTPRTFYFQLEVFNWLLSQLNQLKE